MSDLGTAEPISLVCLDMAGTTVADRGTVVGAFAAAMASEGVEAGTARFDDARSYVTSTMGQSKITVFTHLFDGDGERARRANAAFEESYLGSIEAGRIEAIAGAEATLRALADAGLSLCLTTGFSPATRDAIMEALGWRDLVDLVLSPADAGRGRPYPDMILTAVVRLGVEDVRHVAVVGDTTSDLLAGWRAGASVVAGVLTGAHDRGQLSLAPHTHLLDSVVDLPGIVTGARSTSQS